MQTKSMKNSILFSVIFVAMSSTLWSSELSSQKIATLSFCEKIRTHPRPTWGEIAEKEIVNKLRFVSLPEKKIISWLRSQRCIASVHYGGSTVLWASDPAQIQLTINFLFDQKKSEVFSIFLPEYQHYQQPKIYNFSP